LLPLLQQKLSLLQFLLQFELLLFAPGGGLVPLCDRLCVGKGNEIHFE
jgi:hypothetical protein